MEALQIDEETARKNLQCLATNKFKILLVQKTETPSATPGASQSDVEMIETSLPPKSGSIDDKVFVNKAFTSNLIRLNLPIPALEEVYKKERVV